jgi:sec-independent protein translocase protein TatB
VFGLSFGELVMLLLVAVVVLGPKELPRYLRKAGQLAGQLRRMAYDMRAKSGIDEVLRSEGIGADIAEIRRLASFARGELGSIVSELKNTANGVAIRDATTSPYAPTQAPSTVAATGVAAAGAATRSSTPTAPLPPTASLPPTGPVPARPPAATPVMAAAVVSIDRAREYPTEGADAYGVLPEGSKVYEGQLPPARPEADADDVSPATEAPP